MATFVHNEPTSLSIIQEAGLPESFYKAIETGIEPSIEVFSLHFALCHRLNFVSRFFNPFQMHLAPCV